MKKLLGIQRYKNNFKESKDKFISKYHCKTNFLQYYQVFSSIPNHLLKKARDAGNIPEANYIEDSLLFQLDRDTYRDRPGEIKITAFLLPVK